MIVGVKAQQGSILYFSGIITVCAFIGFALAKVSSNLSGEQRATTPTHSMVHAPALLSVHVIGGWGLKARMPATLAVAAARFESMASTWGRH
jgi:hypothetical protein